MLQKLAHPAISYSLVSVQFAAIFALLWLAPWFYTNAWLVLQILGISLGLWAVMTMHLGHFNIIPDPMPDSKLVSTGPYRWIRHPMYASLLLFFLPTLFQSQSPLIWSVYAVLAFDLLLKLHYEEGLLKKVFDDYPHYQAKTKKLIPFLF